MLTILLSRISLHSLLWWRPWQGSVDRTRWHARLCRGYMISLCHWRPLWCHRRPMWCHRRPLWRHRRALHSNKERPWWSTNLRWKSSRGWRGTWVVRWGLGNWRLGLHAPWKLRWIRGGRWTSRERGGMGDGKLWSWERGLFEGSGPPYDWVGPGGTWAVEKRGWEKGGACVKDCGETGGGAWGWVRPVEEKGGTAFGKGCWAGGGAL